TVLVKVASRCNINCTYCYVYNMGDDNWKNLSKFISEETIDALCISLQEFVENQTKRFSVVLHGGEPFLLGTKKLSHILSRLRSVLPDDYPISIQTNGILISYEILNICSKYRASVAVSIDGPEEVHNKYRVNHQSAGTFKQVIKGIDILASHADAEFLNAGLLAVIDPLSDASEVYRFFKTLSAPSVDFLYKDGNHSKLPLNKSSFSSTEYGEWMVDLLKVYLADPQPLKIRVLDDMLKVLLGGSVSKEGLGITNFAIVIIDTDGSIMKNDTLKSTFNGADKFSQSYNINDLSLRKFLQSDEFSAYCEMQRPSSIKCLSCPELHVCGGGMILNRWSNEDGFNNPSVYCSDQLFLIKNLRNVIAQFNKQYA
ncbi:MAG: radical SAM protein, partial [Chryseobacterium sp.]